MGLENIKLLNWYPDKHASNSALDYKCVRCDEQASLFLGVADPDMQQPPYCRGCCEKQKILLMYILTEKPVPTENEIKKFEKRLFGKLKTD